jgi:hypothetical protein
VTDHWRRVSHLGNPAGSTPWAVTHAALPAVAKVDDDRIELFASSRDEAGRARIGRCRLTIDPSPSLSGFDTRPVLDVGPLGSFDDSGVTMSCVVHQGRTRYLYYTGWTRGVSVPFYLFIGLAISHDEGLTFHRISNAPLLDRGPGDPFLTASPFVTIEGGRWRMWYVSGTRWEATGGGPRHYYHIKYSESHDGIAWERPAPIAIDYEAADEHAFARPCVLRDGDAYRMWYSFRGDKYRIGGAISRDGIVWTRRDDEMGLRAGGDSWESDMVAYPWVFDWQDRRYMLYNGNDYGRTGLGLAVSTSHTPAASSAT